MFLRWSPEAPSVALRIRNRSSASRCSDVPSVVLVGAGDDLVWDDEAGEGVATGLRASFWVLKPSPSAVCAGERDDGCFRPCFELVLEEVPRSHLSSIEASVLAS